MAISLEHLQAAQRDLEATGLARYGWRRVHVKVVKVRCLPPVRDPRILHSQLDFDVIMSGHRIRDILGE